VSTRWIVGLVGTSLIGALAFALVPSRVDRGVADTRAGDPHLVLRGLQVLNRTGPDLVSARRLAEAYERMGQPARGARVLAWSATDGILPMPERLMVRRMALAAGKPALAIPVFDVAARRGDERAHRDLIQLAIWAKKPALALREQQRYLSRHPSDLKALAFARKLAVSAGQRSAALAFQRQLYRRRGSTEDLQNLLDLHLRANDPAGALRELLALGPLTTVAMHDQARQLALWAGDRHTARELAWAAYAIHPVRRRALDLLQTAGPRAEKRAIDLALRVAAEAPDSLSLRRRLRDWLRFQKHSALAEHLLDEDIARAPAATTLHHEKLSLLMGRSQLAQAILELQRYVKRKPTDRKAQMKLAQALTWNGRIAEAWSQYASVLGRRGAGSLSERQSWFAITRPVDDLHPLGRANLEALVKMQPRMLVYRRRLAETLELTGEFAAAVREWRHILRSPNVTRADYVRFVRSLIEGDRIQEATEVVLSTKYQFPSEIVKMLASRSASAEKWSDCSALLSRLVRYDSSNVAVLELLAASQEAAGQVKKASQTWRKRLLMGTSDAGKWFYAAGLFAQSNQPDQALELLRKIPVQARNGPYWRLIGVLAVKLGRPSEAIEAFKAASAFAPQDVGLILTLADLYEKSEDRAEAVRLRENASQLRPRDEGLLLALAGPLVYGNSPEKALPYVERLSMLEPREPESLRLLADFYQSRDAAIERSWLEQLHHVDSGDAQTWFRLAELQENPAADNARQAYTRAVTLADAATSVAEREAGAWALERLAQAADAERAWRNIAEDFPQEPTAFERLARFHLARGELEEATAPLSVLSRLRPDASATLMLQAECLKLSGRLDEAADVLARVPDQDSEGATARAAETVVRRDAGQFDRARQAARRLLLAHPVDADTLDVYRLVRDDAGWAVEVGAQSESYAGLDRQKIAASAWKHFNEQVKFEAGWSQVSWAGGSVQGPQLDVGVEGRQGQWRVESRVSAALIAGNGSVATVSPVARVTIGHQGESWGVDVSAGEQRWEDTNQSLINGGRERSLGLGANWQPADFFGLRVSGSLGTLRAIGDVSGIGSNISSETSLRPLPAAPLTIYHQFQQRGWGTAGSAFGLPESLVTQTLSVAFAQRASSALLEFQPGIAYDFTNQLATPTMAGSLQWDFNPDNSLTASFNWSARALAIGAAGDYQQAQLALRCRF
jgi:tetratricopeptide (TPR) repeat protein